MYLKIGEIKVKMIKSKLKIKVIKKSAVKIYKIPVVSEENLKQKSAKEMISTISGWVNEFQHRRREGTKQAFDRLFVPYSQTGNA